MNPRRPPWQGGRRRPPRRQRPLLLPSTPSLSPYCTVIDTGALQSPSPVFVTARYFTSHGAARGQTRQRRLGLQRRRHGDPGLAAVGAVLPLVRRAVRGDRRDDLRRVRRRSPGFAAKTRGARTGVFRTARPALWMIDAPFSIVASAGPGRSCGAAGAGPIAPSWLSLRVATAPFVRASAAVSAVCSAVMASDTAARAGEGVGNDALPVMPLTMPCAYVMSAGTFVGSLSAATER